MTRTPILRFRNRGSIATLLFSCCLLLLFICYPAYSAGLTWTSVAGNPAEVAGVTLNAVRFLNGQFFAVGTGGMIMSSSDGITWNKRTGIDSARIFQDIAWMSGSGYVAVGDNALFFSASGDSNTWQDIGSSLGATLELKGVVTSPSEFVAVGSNGHLWNSSDGMFHDYSQNTGLIFHDVIWNANQFIVAGSSGVILIGDGTGENSSATFIQGNPTLHGIAWSNTFQKYVVVGIGANIWISNGATANSWSDVSPTGFPFINFWGITEGNGQFIVVGDGETVATSTDGQNWSSEHTGPNALGGVAWGNGRFIAVGDAGTVLVGVPSVSVTSEALNGGVPVNSVAVGTAYQYRYKITNNSGGPITNLSFTDNLDSSVTYTSISNTGIWSNCTAPPTSPIFCQPATLPANSSVSVIVEVSAPSAVGTGKITNNIRLSSPDLPADVLDSLVIGLTQNGGGGGGGTPPPLTGTGGGGAGGYFMLVGLIGTIALSVKHRKRRAASVRTL